MSLELQNRSKWYEVALDFTHHTLVTENTNTTASIETSIGLRYLAEKN